MRWPDAQDQALIERYIVEFGEQGYALCYLLGSLRERGMSSQEADQFIRATHPGKEQT